MRLRVQTALRWMAIIGQSAAVALVYWGFGFDLPLAPVLGVIGLAIALNVILQIGFSAQSFADRTANRVVSGL